MHNFKINHRITAIPTERPNDINDIPTVSLKTTPTKIEIRWPKKIFLGCAVSKSYKTNTINTVAPKENINQIPASVSNVKKASKPMTIAAAKPEAIGSKFF